ncbi:MAG: 2-C-methyl-D-erythritol 4-phosphate cytidylyltransferase [Firmicutes bacterium]|jgi:2-C-methyl-D-erythritol 4-phosphate cytidylyltransferase/2-C-methyl-D-erythritol 2,4-cyclodiphosphate synthase|nr:2-C-methyl-D-erythritol 4-phosphate cytidylyltransferase [Bacillota bacterium]
MNVGVVIAAAGSGRRMGSAGNKVLLPLDGKPILAYSLQLFAAFDVVSEIIVVTREMDLEVVDQLIDALGLGSIARTIPGGKERQESVYLGLEALREDTEWVIIHDGARPYVTRELVEKALQDCYTYKAVTLGVPVTDTIKVVEDGIVAETLERSTLWSIQTPQIFSFSLIKHAHQKAKQSGFSATDDCMLLEKLGVPVHVTQGSYGNIKITTPEDLPLEENGVTTMIGLGFDVHRLVPDRELILCGVRIPYEKGLLGHSDGDAATHAVMDALLGAAALGDIGEMFPDSDPQYKDIWSILLLRQVMDEISKKGLVVSNLDLTIMAERPKLSPWKDQMRNNLAEVLGVAKNKINIKATTVEGLGFVGREEGMAAQAVVSLRKDLNASNCHPS